MYFFSKSTSQFIRDYLLEKEEAYPYEIYRAYKNTYPHRKGNAHTFYRLIAIMRDIGLIQRSGRVEKGLNFDRVYYKINTKNINSKKWINPYKAYINGDY